METKLSVQASHVVDIAELVKWALQYLESHGRFPDTLNMNDLCRQLQEQTAQLTAKIQNTYQ